MSEDFTELKGFLFDADLAIKKAMHFTHILKVEHFHELSHISMHLGEVMREIIKWEKVA